MRRGTLGRLCIRRHYSITEIEDTIALIDLNAALKETTDATNAAVQHLTTELAGVKKQLGDQQKLVGAMYRRDFKQ